MLAVEREFKDWEDNEAATIGFLGRYAGQPRSEVLAMTANEANRVMLKVAEFIKQEKKQIGPQGR